MLGWQIPIVTEGQHKNSRIISVNSKPILENLNNDHVVVVPGFQGVSEKLRISTIGRGGSDASAVALAKALDADREFLKAGGVFDDDTINAYIALKMEEVQAFQANTHPLEFEMYYSL